MRALITSILINILLLIYFLKNSCQHFDGGGDFHIFFDSLNFEEGSDPPKEDRLSFYF